MRIIRKTMLLTMLVTFTHTVAQEPIPFVLQKNWYSKQMADVFSDLQKNKLLKVEEGWQDIEKKFSKEKGDLATSYGTVDEMLFPLWQLSRIALLNAKEGRKGQKAQLTTPYDPWQAYAILRKVVVENDAVSLANAFFGEKKLRLTVKDIKQDIEKNLIDTVRVIATEDAYDRLLDILFNCDETGTLRKERELLAFNSVAFTEDVQECERFITKYKQQNRLHEELIISRRDSLAFAQMDTTVADCQYYLKSYPKSRYRNEVVNRLHRYEFNQLAHTPEACQAYLDKYPSSVYATQVSKLKVRYAFDAMKANIGVESCSRFLETYRQSDYAVSQGMVNEAMQLLSQALKRKYISRNSSLSSLEQLMQQGAPQNADISLIKRYYYNLLYQPVSAFMNGCEDLTGRVVISYNQNGEDIEEVMDFNDQGLLTSRRHSKTGLSENYSYTFSDTHGYELAEKTDNSKGRTTTYTSKYSADGALQELVGSDGSKIVYSYLGDKLDKVAYMRNGTAERTDYYDSSANLIEKSVRSGNSIVYEYNYRGDMVSMKKMKGSTAMATTTYEYEYPDEGLPWNRMSQYNDGSFLLSKTRSYNTPKASSRNTATSSQEVEEVVEEVIAGDTSPAGNKVFEVVEQMPSFPGGDAALMQFLSKAIKYPVEAEDNGIQGRVVATFVIERDGSISEVRVVKSVAPSLDQEAIRVLKSMPKWIPGFQNGKPVRVKYTTPVTFRLQ